MTPPSLMAVVRELLERLETGELHAGLSRPLRRGSAHGTVSVTSDPHDPDTLVLVVRMAIMTVPGEADRAFFEALLELNDRLEGRAAFALAPDRTVQLVAGRPLDDLDPSELIDLILWTADQADHHDDLLLQRFGER